MKAVRCSVRDKRVFVRRVVTLQRPIFRPFVSLVFAVITAFSVASAFSQSRNEIGDNAQIILASTTSTQASGLYDHLLPQFTADSGITVHVIAVGTGRAITLASKGDADVLLVHHRASEDQFVEDGYGLVRHDVMYNDFVLVGPEKYRELAPEHDIDAWLKAIFEQSIPFASRGDDSGTHKKELGLWKAIDADPVPHSGDWYRETGSGMGATLNTAIGLSAIVLTDRGTWLNFKNRADFKILCEGAPPMLNPYGVILVNPEKFSHVKAKAGQAFIDWLLSDKGQAAIASYKVNGEQLFFPYQ